MGFFDAVGSYFESEAANEAIQKAAERNQEAKDRQRTTARNAALGTNETFGTVTTAGPGGETNVNFIPGSSQEIAAGGNLQRQIAANELTGTPTAPSQGDINLALQERDTRNYRRFEDTRNEFLKGLLRKPGARDNNTGFPGAATREIGDFATANRANTPVERLTLPLLLNEQGTRTRSQELQNLSNRGVTPVAGPGNNIAQVIGAQQLTPTPTDLSGAIPFAAAGGYMDYLQRQQAAEEESRRFNEALEVYSGRQVGNSNNGNMGGYRVDPRIDDIFPSRSQVGNSNYRVDPRIDDIFPSKSGDRI